VRPGARRLKACHATVQGYACYRTPQYLGPVVRVVDLPCRQSLHSAGAYRLVVPPFILSTIGTRAFPVASPRIWNSLHADITLAHSMSTFCQQLKTYLFQQSFTHLYV